MKRVGFIAVLLFFAVDAPPIFDGLISANGKVFVSLENGAVECW